MKVVVIRLNPFWTVELDGVTGISLADGVYTVTTANDSYVYAESNYKLMILW